MPKQFWFAVAVFILLFALLCFLLLGCKVLKKSSYKNSDSTSLSKNFSKDKIDSTGGSVSKNNSISKELSDWWKTTVVFPKDTSINNFYSYPSTVIMEGGKNQKEVESNNTDSSWFFKAIENMQSKIDSLSVSKSQGDSSKKSDVSTKTLIFGVVVLYLLVELFKFVSSRYKISRK